MDFDDYDKQSDNNKHENFDESITNYSGNI
jgi:hypothetical protein